MLIASSSKDNKFSANGLNFYDFANHSSAIVEPMLSRVKNPGIKSEWDLEKI
jgi:hypothetical protein